jgi:hypothetical protein
VVLGFFSFGSRLGSCFSWLFFPVLIGFTFSLSALISHTRQSHYSVLVRCSSPLTPKQLHDTSAIIAAAVFTSVGNSTK